MGLWGFVSFFMAKHSLCTMVWCALQWDLSCFCNIVSIIAPMGVRRDLGFLLHSWNSIPGER